MNRFASIAGVVGLAICCVSLGAPPARGVWSVYKSVDNMTDEPKCALSYSKDSNVFYKSTDELVISFYRRGGIGSYRYRVDKRRPSDLVLSTEGQRNFIVLQNYDSEFMDASTLRVEGLTFLDSIFSMDIDLKGLREARATMATACGLPPMPVVGNTDVGPGGWPKVPDSVSGGK